MVWDHRVVGSNPTTPTSCIYSIMKEKKLFSWPERITGYFILGYLGYVLACMILGTFDII